MNEVPNRAETKQRVIELWSSIERPGKDRVIDYLNNSDFFTAPSSTNYHLNVIGGLAKHSLNVYDVLKRKVEEYGIEYSKDTLIVAALGHDLCKVDFYVIGSRNVKDDLTGRWEKKEVWKVEDQFPIGHGEKSLTILQDMIGLYPAEKLAIRWHMGLMTPGVATDYPTKCAYDAAQKELLVPLLQLADSEASLILER